MVLVNSYCTTVLLQVRFYGRVKGEHDDRILLDLAGYKSARVIAKMLHRSEAAIGYRLTTLGKSSRVHVEGFTRSALASELHLSMGAIQLLIVEGLLEVRDPRIIRESLDRLRESGRLEVIRQTEGHQAADLTSLDGSISRDRHFRLFRMIFAGKAKSHSRTFLIVSINADSPARLSP